MGIQEALAILPILIMAFTATIVLLATAFHRSHLLAYLLSISGQVIAFASIFTASTAAPRRVTSLLTVDRYSHLFMGLLIAAAFTVTVISYGYLEKHEEEKEEFYVLLLLAMTGSLVLTCSSHFASFFLALEILSVSLYIMIGYLGYLRLPLEAALKYLILAAASTSFLVFGMALVYADARTMDFSRIASAAAGPDVLLLTGFALVVSGIGFKLALVPFHMWTPDVYQGAPAPVAAFIATVSKGAVFAFLLRYFLETDVYDNRSLFTLLSIVSIASMIAGNFLALLQNSLKRILAYSAIAHLGYLLVAFLAGREFAAQASIFYLAAYFAGILSAFGVISLLSSGEEDRDDLDRYRGLVWQRPWLAGAMTASLLSLAGIPLTAGFVGKFYLLTAGIGSAHWLLVLVLIASSGIGLFYYLRIIVRMYTPLAAVGELEIQASEAGVQWMGNFVIAGLILVLVWLGVYPSFLLQFIGR